MNHFSIIQSRLSEYNIDALLLCSESNRYYASGFATCADEDAVLFITPEKCFFITDSRYTEAAEGRITEAEVYTRAAGETYLSIITGLVEKYSVSRLGFEGRFMSFRDYERYSTGIKAKLITADGLLSSLRETKDEDEVRSMIKAQRISEAALEKILPELKPGMTEKQIAAKLVYYMMDLGAERTSFDPIVAAGPNGSMPHAVPTEREIRRGEFITMDFGCKYNGYCSDMTRTVALGSVTDEMKTVYNVVLEAQLAGIAAAKAGVKGCDVHNAAARVIADAGYGQYFGHGFGHSLGIDIHEDPGFRPSNSLPVPAGAVISAEPGIYIPGKFGVRIEDVVIVREGGCEIITKAPKELMIL